LTKSGAWCLTHCMRAKGFVLLLVLSLGSGCGSATKTEGNASGGAVSAPPPTTDTTTKITSDYLLGTWISGCRLDPKRSQIYIKEYLTFDDTGEVDRLSTSYLDSSCSVALYQQTLTAKFNLSNDGRYSEVRKSVSISPLSTTAVGLFTQYQGFCGDPNWNLNEERTFSNVHSCGIDANVKMILSAKDDHGISELDVRECRPMSHSHCANLSYMRAN